MRRTVLGLLTAALVLVRVPLHADDLVYERLGSYLDALRNQTGIPGLVAAVVGRNDLLWQRPFGYQDVDRLVATRTDTPFHIGELTQTITASLILRCAEEGRLSLDDPIAMYDNDAPEQAATLRQYLSHTSAARTFTYRPSRLEPLIYPIQACTGTTFRETVAGLFEQFAMVDSVPGPDVTLRRFVPQGIVQRNIERYSSALSRLTLPYAVDKKGHAFPSLSGITTLTPATGVISTVRDLAQFDMGLRRGVLLREDTLAAAWRGVNGNNGTALPHGLGWFVQSYKGETVVWQYGWSENASSAMMITLPSRGLTLILLANSDSLVKPFPLQAGDVSVSPFAGVFLGLFIR